MRGTDLIYTSTSIQVASPQKAPPSYCTIITDTHTYSFSALQQLVTLQSKV